MSEMVFNSQEKKILVHKIQHYFQKELCEENTQNLTQTFYKMEEITEFIK